jgi:hypothetical protein
LHHVALLLALLLPLQAPDFLHEPDYAVVNQGGHWIVQKPGVGDRPPVTISQHLDRAAAESRKRSLPRLRLSGMFVRFDPATYERTLIADWTGQQDALHTDAGVREILNRFAPVGVRALLQSTPVYMARLFGATGHTAEESTDHARFVIYLDPFRATGRLHAAATLAHELAHLERYRARGFHANRAAAVLPKKDFILLGLTDEFAAYRAEGNLVQSFLDSRPDEGARRAARDAIRKPELNWPVALTVLLGLEGPSDQGRRMDEARRQVALDVERNARSYWDSHHRDSPHPYSMDPALRKTIRDWYRRSREWKEIAAARSEWAISSGAGAGAEIVFD